MCQRDCYVYKCGHPNGYTTWMPCSNPHVYGHRKTDHEHFREACAKCLERARHIVQREADRRQRAARQPPVVKQQPQQQQLVKQRMPSVDKVLVPALKHVHFRDQLVPRRGRNRDWDWDERGVVREVQRVREVKREVKRNVKEVRRQEEHIRWPHKDHHRAAPVVQQRQQWREEREKYRAHQERRWDVREVVRAVPRERERERERARPQAEPRRMEHRGDVWALPEPRRHVQRQVVQVVVRR
ncbi:hypothetical protein SPI_04509 [Niveomyces insectorum RCEF 264]|uniref:Uncharacterized protein n=1 Tax=Niveomyces insectorum RCEF 264 TaxID=1081102 RepID=A0A167UJY9_9HYPO|nr:hypothetical protein SPI_04509 [Niveomyces insectorum RCEF 264]